MFRRGRHYEVILLISVILCYLVCRHNGEKCKASSTNSESTNKTTCLERNGSQFSINCTESNEIALIGIVIGVRKGCGSETVSTSCCIPDQYDQLIDGNCLREATTNFSGIYDTAVNLFLETFSTKHMGNWRDSRAIPIPKELGYNATSSSYISFLYTCLPKFKPVHIYKEESNGLNICNKGYITRKSVVVRHLELQPEYDDCKCQITSKVNSLNINVQIFDVRFHINDRDNCSGSELLMMKANNDVIYQTDCKRLNLTNFNITNTSTVIVKLNALEFLLNQTVIWMKIQGLDDQEIDVYCGVAVYEPSPERGPGIESPGRGPGIESPGRGPDIQPPVVYILSGFASVFIGIVIIIVVSILYRRWRRNKKLKPGEIEVIPLPRVSNSYDYVTLSRNEDPTENIQRITKHVSSEYDNLRVGKVIEKLNKDNYDELDVNPTNTKVSDADEPCDNYDHITTKNHIKIVKVRTNYDLLRLTLNRADKKFNHYDHVNIKQS